MALSMSLIGGAQAQTTQDKVRVGDTDVKVHSDHLRTGDRLSDLTTSAQVTPIGKANKTSSLIGMDVRNSQNEKLGEIKDMVVDLHSGKVAYVVLSVGGFLGIGDKYIAIPPSAFSVAPDQDKLVLNADKAKLQNAPSFAKTSWPELNSPTWNTDLSYWGANLDTTAQGTIGASRTGTYTATSDPKLDRDRPLSSSASHLDRGTASSVADRDQFRGRITAINPETRTMTVEGPSGTRQFKFSETAVITLKDSRNPRLTDLKVGYPVVVGFHESGGTYTADSVIRSDTPEVR